MGVSEEIQRRRHAELAECFAVIDTCLAAYYGGAKHMYRPLAGQLRILFCDKDPLLGRVFPDLKISAVRRIEWLSPEDTTLFEAANARLTVEHDPIQEFSAARMPFLITQYETGLQVADLEFNKVDPPLPLDEWLSQLVTVHPSELSLREVIRSVADKGGGAHVDDTVNSALHDMCTTGPAGVGVQVLFSVAIGRLAQQIGLRYIQFRERFGDHGRLQDIVFDPKHATVESSARVPRELEEGPRKQFAFTILKRIK